MGLISKITLGVVIIILLTLIINYERKVLYDPDGKNKGNAEVTGGNSHVYVRGAPEDKDTPESSLGKLLHLSSYRERTPSKGRIAMTSLICGGVLLPFVFLGGSSKLSTTARTVAAIIILYLVLTGFEGYYAFHYHRFPEHYMRENISSLGRKVGSPQPPSVVNVKKLPDHHQIQ